MDIKGKTIWQIAAGNGKDTHYAKTCLENDVVILGPGRYGSWPDCADIMRREGWTSHKVGITRRFVSEVKAGDIVVLRVGTQYVYGVGEVVGDYGWSDLFRNIQGWDLQHYRRVRWLWHQNGTPKTFPVYSLKLGSSVQYLTDAAVQKWLEGLSVPEEAYSRPLQPL